MIVSDNNFLSSNSDSTKANPFNLMLSKDIAVRNVDNRAKFFSSSEPSSLSILLNSASLIATSKRCIKDFDNASKYVL